MSESKKSKLLPRSAKLERIVTDKQPVLHPEQSVQTAGDKMREVDADSLPVSEGRRLVGVVDRPDPDRRAAGYGHDPNTLQVREIMNNEIIYCFEEDDCAEALRTMEARHVDRMPVVDRQMRIVGVVSRADLLESGGGGSPSRPRASEKEVAVDMNRVSPS